MKKKHRQDIFCACCRSPRKLRHDRHLSSMNYLQILVLTLVFSACTFPWLVWKGAMSLPVIWALFESIHKALYRKDLKCPFCGFDPTWYKKDVRFARQKVEEFLKENPNSPVFKRTRAVETSDSYWN